jgi:formimidoylglutamate deiminase
MPVDARWCLIHATQMAPHETTGLAASGAVAGLCPITEANLGDGIFDGARYLAAGGRFGLGSDSNVRISLTEEMRMLEYSQRLGQRARAVLARPGASTGRVILQGAVEGGAQAAGRASGAIREGLWADLVALRGDGDLAGRSGDTILDSWIFAAGDGQVSDLWSAGRHLISDGRHARATAITERFRGVMARLGQAL